MLGPMKIKEIQSKTIWAQNEIHEANNCIMDVIEFLCCNKFMRVLRFLFRKKFDKQYDKLSKAWNWMDSASGILDERWDLLEECWDQTANEYLEKYKAE